MTAPTIADLREAAVNYGAIRYAEGEAARGALGFGTQVLGGRRAQAWAHLDKALTTVVAEPRLVIEPGVRVVLDEVTEDEAGLKDFTLHLRLGEQGRGCLVLTPDVTRALIEELQDTLRDLDDDVHGEYPALPVVTA